MLSSVHELYVGNRTVSVGAAIVVSKNGPLEASLEPSRKISMSLKPWENIQALVNLTGAEPAIFYG